MMVYDETVCVLRKKYIFLHQMVYRLTQSKFKEIYIVLVYFVSFLKNQLVSLSVRQARLFVTNCNEKLVILGILSQFLTKISTQLTNILSSSSRFSMLSSP